MALLRAPRLLSEKRGEIKNLLTVPQEETMRCPDCGSIGRRDFLKTVAAGGATLATTIAAPRLSSAASAPGSTAPVGTSETLVGTLYKGLTPAQREQVTFPFGHPLRAKVVLQEPGYWQRRRVGCVAIGKPDDGVVFPRRTACPRLGEHPRRRVMNPVLCSAFREGQGSCFG